MPRTTREWAKRKLKAACNTINWAGTHLQEVVEVYQKDHCEISDPLVKAQSVLLIAQDLIEKVAESF